MARKKNRLSLWIPILVIAVLAALVVWQMRQDEQEATQPSREFSELEKVITAPGTDERIIHYDAFTVSFNPRLHIPNWVSWELTGEETMGATKRADKFACDSSIDGCAQPSDYSDSGYDRGHMAPAGDMKWDPTAMEQTFYMTNICPQVHTLNAGSWKKLEEKCRQWAQIDSAIIIVCGPVPEKRHKEYIGDTRVAVPRAFFKVILSPYANPPRGIGFIMPNGKVPGGMQAAAMSIDEVEQATGHDFFSELPDEIENAVESQNQFHLWSTLR